MTIFIGTTNADKTALRVAAHRGSVRALARNLFTDDFDSDPVHLVSENLIAIIGRLLPDWHLSYSTAATRTANDGFAFVAGKTATKTHLLLPGVRIVRAQDLPYAEVDSITAPTMISPGLDREPQTVKVAVSSMLQTVFECLSSVKHYRAKHLPEPILLQLIKRLGPFDRERAQAFAARNELRNEYWRLLELVKENDVAATVHLAAAREFEVFFYNWKIGNFSGLARDEFRFAYSHSWSAQLSNDLPANRNPSYEGRGMPAFFENLLPEGWMESQLQATFKIAKEDKLALLESTTKYLSNLTLRGTQFVEGDLHFDTLDHPLSSLAPIRGKVLKVKDEIAQVTSLQTVMRALGSKGPMRVSGVQAKLPAEMALLKDVPVLRLGVLGNSCSYIIKYQSPNFPHMVENEWATMEIARRLGLPTANVQMIELVPDHSAFAGRSLLIERYDIPPARDLERGGTDLRLALQQDAASLLSLSRTEKYDTSGEQITRALMDVDLAESDLWLFLKHVVYSWLIGNGDLHAKNISIINWMKPGQLGSLPQLDRVAYSPLYDLVNTRVYLPDDYFAFRLNGRNDNLKTKDFAQLATRWGGTKAQAKDIIAEISQGIDKHLDEVIDQSLLPKALAASYKRIVRTNIADTRP